MTQALIMGALLLGLGGLIWVIASSFMDANRRMQDDRHQVTTPDQPQPNKPPQRMTATIIRGITS